MGLLLLLVAWVLYVCVVYMCCVMLCYVVLYMCCVMLSYIWGVIYIYVLLYGLRISFFWARRAARGAGGPPLRGEGGGWRARWLAIWLACEPKCQLCWLRCRAKPCQRLTKLGSPVPRAQIVMPLAACPASKCLAGWMAGCIALAEAAHS